MNSHANSKPATGIGKIVCLIAVTLMPLSAAGAMSDWFEGGHQLAAEKGCLDCHTLGRDDAGPSFRAIARRYQFRPDHKRQLPKVIRGGSAGHWGDRFVMWPQPHLNDDEV